MINIYTTIICAFYLLSNTDAETGIKVGSVETDVCFVISQQTQIQVHLFVEIHIHQINKHCNPFKPDKFADVFC